MKKPTIKDLLKEMPLTIKTKDGKSITLNNRKKKSCSTCRFWTPKPDFQSGPCFAGDDDAPRAVKKAEEICGAWEGKG